MSAVFDALYKKRISEQLNHNEIQEVKDVLSREGEINCSFKLLF